MSSPQADRLAAIYNAAFDKQAADKSGAAGTAHAAGLAAVYEEGAANASGRI